MSNNSNQQEVTAGSQALVATAPHELKNRTYWGEVRRFIRFVDSREDLRPTIVPPGDKPVYLTRKNIDTFFKEEVALRTVQPTTVGKVLPALRQYAKYVEHINGSFIVDSPIVAAALDDQKALFRSEGGTGKKGQDPHYGLKDNLSTGDKVLIMDYIYRVRPTWGRESFTFTWGNNAALRGASNLKLGYADLRMSTGYGAEEEGKLSRTLLVILRKGSVHKDRHDTDDQIAVWRHKEQKLCTVFSTAAHILWSLKNDPDINFYHQNKDARASWWDKPIVDWKDTKEVSASMKHVYENTGVVNSKVTHHRTAALQYAGFGGLGPHQINTLTNHIIQKQSSAYGPVAERETVAFMAGFNERINPYRMERGLTELPAPINTIEEQLFGGKLSEWRSQAASATGDKSSCCFNFLNELIPWLIEVLVQDGIYFIQDFPDHPITNWLRNSIPRYDRWALSTRRYVKEREEAFVPNEIRTLNAGYLSALQTLSRRFDSLQTENRNLRNTLDQVQNALVRQNETNERILQLLEQRQPLEAAQEQEQVPPPTVAPLVAPVATPVAAVAPPVPVPAPVVAPPVPAGNNNNNNNINDVLRPVPAQPAFNTSMPSTLLILHTTWQENGLTAYENAANKKRWTGSVRQAFDKQQYLIEKIREKKRDDETEQQAAIRLDAFREEHGATVRQYYDYLKKNDPKTKTRNYPAIRRKRVAAIQADRRRVANTARAVPVGPNRQRARAAPAPAPALRSFTIRGDGDGQRGAAFWAGRRSDAAYQIANAGGEQEGGGFGFGQEHAYGHTSNQRFDDSDMEMV